MMLLRVMTYNLGDWGKRPAEAARHRAAVDIVRQYRPHILFAQELFVPAGEPAQAVAARMVRAAGMDAAVGVEGNHAQLATCIGWRSPVVMRRGSARRARSDRFWHALHGATLRVGGRAIGCWVYHGPPRVGRDETIVEAERVSEAHLVAAHVAGGDDRCAVVCGDWNWLPADRAADGGYWHPDPVMPDGLTAAQARLALSRAPGQVLVDAGLASVGAALRRPLTQTSTGHEPPPSMRGTDYGARLIDEGLVTPALVEALVDHQVVDTPAARATSDHLPTIFTLDLRRIGDARWP
ncbi:endonuclease/exonuclease/phosphatase family protein [Micromonospora sp. WMMD1082]|uniref:endonuclease/exonuclease/phosphatase family protein n=1 Tax=Micromonospora sp. WMMD1082 TaxID=3016104 RepID=UPI0024172780|nr:endonuclease/exonuclease/phosphatase family protein [Micromonospora sp. WMMD1082]MDG4795515.1 endonuclease/exonuclease/phosphatase family protein [Micromonospora sp. WMMD1082]